MTQVIFEYFKKELDDGLILVRINPSNYHGLELLVTKDQHVLETERSFDKTIYEDLKVDEFQKSSPLEFNLYLKGIGSEK